MIKEKLAKAFQVNLSDVDEILLSLNVKGWAGSDGLNCITHAGAIDNASTDTICGHNGYWVSDGEYIAVVTSGDPYWSDLNDEDACTDAGLIWGNVPEMLKKFAI